MSPEMKASVKDTALTLGAMVLVMGFAVTIMCLPTPPPRPKPVYDCVRSHMEQRVNMPDSVVVGSGVGVPIGKSGLSIGTGSGISIPLGQGTIENVMVCDEWKERMPAATPPMATPSPRVGNE